MILRYIRPDCVEQSARVLVESPMKLRYFCEGCGKEVPRNSHRCPHCGKFFTSVQCPRCGHQGESRTFEAGCPSCGYLRLPQATLTRIGMKAGGGSRGSPVLYRVIGIVLGLALLGLLTLLYLRSGR
jgi:DNA-directed RNA polymerase subunit RPC12/RpoP